MRLRFDKEVQLTSTTGSKGFWLTYSVWEKFTKFMTVVKMFKSKKQNIRRPLGIVEDF
jgi:hypothetical protein